MQDQLGPCYGTMEPTKVDAATKRRLRRRIEALVSILAAGLSLGVLWAGRLMLVNAAASVAMREKEDRVSWQVECEKSVCLYASNAYERLLGRPVADGHFDGIILEMYQTTRIEIDAKACELEVSGDADVNYIGGCAMEVRAMALGVYGLTARVIERHSRKARLLSFDMTAKYVRREVRDLTVEDRERYLDAIAVTLHVNDEEGTATYGDKYHSMDYFVRLYLFSTSLRDADGWRFSPVFANMHTAMAAQFERTLQSIDPRIAMPYWDFTIDYTRENYGHWPNLIVYGDDWFSTANPHNSDHIVDTGRFAFTPIRTSARSFSKVTNPYGVLSAPWNTNPSPFVTRTVFHFGEYAQPFEHCVSCETFRQSMRNKHTFASLMNDLSHIFHAFVEVNTGGAWNYLQALDEHQDALGLVSSARGKLLSLAKAYWRNGYVSCPEFCAHDTPRIQCACHLSTAVIKAFAGSTSYAIFNSTRDLSLNCFGNRLDEVPSEAAVWDLALEQVANGGYPVTLSSDGAPNDPLFWLLPGMFERYMHQIRYLNANGQYDFDMSWGFETTPANPVYDWTSVHSAYTLPNIIRTPPTGSHEDDLIPFKADDILLGVGASAVTNREFFNMTAPFSPHLRYVYDQLLHWSQCGYVFGYFPEINE